MAAHANAYALPVADGFLVGTGPGSSTPQILYGWSVHESSGTPAVASFLIRDGSVTGNIVAAVELAADGDDTVWFGDRGVRVPGGIFVDRVAGTVEGSVFAG